MAARSDAWFRRVGTVSLTTSGGSQVQGFGAVLPWREERADLWGERPHALGRLPGPLYQFVGSFPQLLEAQGAQLTQGEERYRVCPEAVRERRAGALPGAGRPGSHAGRAAAL